MRDFWAAVTSKEYWLLLGISASGYFALSPSLIVPAALLLTFWSVVSSADHVSQFRAIAKLHVLAGFWLLCLLHNAAFIAAAYGIGIATRWFWAAPPPSA